MGGGGVVVMGGESLQEFHRGINSLACPCCSNQLPWLCVCVCVRTGGVGGCWRGGLAIKWRGLLLIIALWPRTKAKKTARTIWIWIASLLPLSFFFLPRFLFLCLRLALDDKSGANKDSAQSNQANSANKLSVGSSLSVLTLSTVSVAKQRLKCLATRRHSILMEWLPHARLPCAWSLRLQQKKKDTKTTTTKETQRRGGEKIINYRRSPEQRIMGKESLGFGG